VCCIALATAPHTGAAICACLTLRVNVVTLSVYDVYVLPTPVAIVLVVWSLLKLLLLLHTLLLNLSRTAFTKNGVTFSGRDDYEAALSDTSHPGHTEANARAKDAKNRGEHRDSRPMLSALYHDQLW
jgi:hypothetical protein